MTRLTRVMAAAVAMLPLLVVVDGAPAQAVEIPGDPRAGQAVFEGDVIDLGRDWGEATACAITETVTRCFRSEAQMDRFLDAQVGDDASSNGRAGFRAAASTTCSSPIRLYDGTWYKGAVLSTSIRWTYLNLKNFGFDNRTSSYRVGDCGVELYGGMNGSGGVYPGGTWAGASSGSMVNGWNNVVSSMYMF